MSERRSRTLMVAEVRTSWSKQDVITLIIRCPFGWQSDSDGGAWGSRDGGCATLLLRISPLEQ